MGDTAIVYRATIDGAGYTTVQQIEVTVEGEHTSRDGVEHTPAAFVSGDAQLKAAGLRRLAAACIEAADHLDHLAMANPS